jgi:hypothetical protein
MYVHPIEGPFRFAQDKDSELEVTFPGGMIRITAAQDGAQIIVNCDDGMKIAPGFKIEDAQQIVGHIFNITPGNPVIVEGQANRPKLPNPPEWDSELTDLGAHDDPHGFHLPEPPDAPDDDPVYDFYEPDEYDDGRDFDEPYPPEDDANYLHF